MPETRIVVVGAGVSGLTSALLLSRDPRYKITVVAKHMPGDYDIEYASPWAGANYMPVSASSTAAAQHDRDTWPEFERLARDRLDAGVHFQETRNFRKSTDSGPVADWQSESAKADAWFKDVVPNFRPLKPSELRGHDSGTSYTSVCINTAIYLPWLVSQCLLAGVTFHRAILSHISEAAALFRTSPSAPTAPGTQSNPNGHINGLSELQRANVIVNCTGLGSKKLGGVQDTKMYPARGQIVLVRNETPFMGGTTSVQDGEDEACYIMGRAVGGGTILGGCYQPHNYESAPDPNLAIRIMKRCVELIPELVQGKHPTEAQPPPKSGEQEETHVSGADIAKLSVVRHGVGLRPCREGGVRLEREKLVVDNGAGEEGGDGKATVWVVHDYGHAGYGYQSSYGCSMEVVRLVGECVEEMKGAVFST